MSRLAEYQRALVADLLYDTRQGTRFFSSGGMSFDVALSVHRETIYGGLVRALGLTFPTVLAVIGEAEFHKVSVSFVATSPPTHADLTRFGHELPSFIASLRQPHSFPPWLSDVAALDHALDRAAHAPVDVFSDPLPVDDKVFIAVARSLGFLDLEWPAPDIRDVVGCATGENALDAVERRRTRLVIWRSADGVRLRVMSRAPFEYLTAIAARSSSADALAMAAGQGDAEGVARSIAQEVFTAPFVHLSLSPTGSTES